MNRMIKRIPLFLMAALFLPACTNQMTLEGQVGYIQHEPLIFGEAYFVGTQRGPTSTGLVWRQYVTNVDVRPKNYTEVFSILSKDNLNIGFEAHARISIDPERVQDLVEDYGTAEPWRLGNEEVPEWYIRTVRQPFRTAVRDAVHDYDAYDIQSATQEISTRILAEVQELYAGTPIQLETLSIGNLAYPAEINAEIQRKLAAEQDLERMSRELQIAGQQAQITITNSRGRANAQRIVNETLTPLYVQHEALEGIRELAHSARAQIVLAPSSDRGGSPLMLNMSR